MRLLLVLIALILLVAGCGFETVSERYDTVAQARAEGLFTRGWVPNVLPDQAGPLRSVHNLDTNARCAVAEVPAEASWEVDQALRAAGFVPLDGTLPPPSLRRCPFGLAEIDASHVLIRQTARGDLELAAMGAQGPFYFWSARTGA